MFVNGWNQPLWPVATRENSGRFYIVANEKDEKAWSSDLALVDTEIDWFFRWVLRGWVERHLTHFSLVIYIVDENMIPSSKGTLMEHLQSSNFCWDQEKYQHLVTCRWGKTSNQFFQVHTNILTGLYGCGRGCGWTNKHVYVDLYLFLIYSLMGSKMFEFSLLKTHLMYSKTIDLHVIHIPIFWVNESSTCFWSHRF